MTLQKSLLFWTIAVLLLAVAYFAGTSALSVKAATQPGIAAVVATSSVDSLAAASVGNLFATSTCAARIVTTTSSGVMLTFSDFNGGSPSNTSGHLQAASTTSVYDASLFGCGLFKAYSFAAATVTVSESR